MVYSFFKRLFDLIVALLVFLIVLPLFIIIILSLLLLNNGKPFFIQVRPGEKNKLFKIIKFKTMNEKKDTIGNLLPPAERITAIGKFIRSTSLDEIPQLLNVIKGDMSLVGPRPLRVEYLPHYSQFQARRHDVKPGITGWAQVNGRNTLDWDEKFKLDVWYVDNRSFFLDIKILVLTIYKVIKKDGVNQGEKKTMEPFKGIKLNG